MTSRSKRITLGCGIGLVVAMLVWDFVDGFKGQHSVKAGLISFGSGLLWLVVYGGWALPKGKDDDGPTAI